MPFLRSLAFAVIIALATMIWATLCFLFAPLPYPQRYYMTTRWSVFYIWASRVICGIRHRVIGMENFPDAPVIMLSKHQSSWETVFYTILPPCPLVFVFKRELLWIPFFGWGIGLLRMIAINRSKGRDAFESVVEQGKRRLADGQWIIMFPEGTRIPVGKQGKYKTGGTRLAIRTNALVVPIAVNSGECSPKNSFIKKPGLITVSIGKPISPEDETPDSMMDKVEIWIEGEMRRISPHIYSKEEAIQGLS